MFKPVVALRLIKVLQDLRVKALDANAKEQLACGDLMTSQQRHPIYTRASYRSVASLGISFKLPGHWHYHTSVACSSLTIVLGEGAVQLNATVFFDGDGTAGDIYLDTSRSPKNTPEEFAFYMDQAQEELEKIIDDWETRGPVSALQTFPVRPPNTR